MKKSQIALLLTELFIAAKSARLSGYFILLARRFIEIQRTRKLIAELSGIFVRRARYATPRDARSVVHI